MHFIKHFITITKHRHKVLVYCFRCGLYRQGLVHDLSKYSFTEFIPGAKYCTGSRSQYILKDKIKAIALLGFTTKVEINIILNIGLT